MNLVQRLVSQGMAVELAVQFSDIATGDDLTAIWEAIDQKANRTGAVSVLFRLFGADLATTADQELEAMWDFNEYIPTSIMASNVSDTVTNTSGGIYTGANKSGVVVTAANQSWAGFVNATRVVYPSIAPTGQAIQDYNDTSKLYLSLTTASTEPRTCDILVLGVARKVDE